MSPTLTDPRPAVDFQPAALPRLEAALLTGGQDRHYAYGLATALAARNVALDVLGSSAEDGPEMHATPGLRFFELYGAGAQTGRAGRIRKVLSTYARLLRYAATARPRLVHILWDYKLPVFDRTLFLVYLKLLGKKIALTAHNVNAARRDGADSLLNRFTLRFQYRCCDRIFVHTEKMKSELVEQFGVRPAVVTVIPFGVNNAVPDSGISRAEARQRLGLGEAEQVILFFGAIKPYKGLEHLVAAFESLSPAQPRLRLLIAGERKKGWETYWDAIAQTIDRSAVRAQVLRFVGFIPDSGIEAYMKAADVAVLPYTEIFQSGILFLAYAFGLPVIATDVGSLHEDVVDGQTGFLCRARDPQDLARVIERYFASDLYAELAGRRARIREHFLSRHSWETVAGRTQEAYAEMLKR